VLEWEMTNEHSPSQSDKPLRLNWIPITIHLFGWSVNCRKDMGAGSGCSDSSFYWRDLISTLWNDDIAAKWRHH
jgi:hypothetical protein